MQGDNKNSWFDDDPEWEALRRSVGASRATGQPDSYHADTKLSAKVEIKQFVGKAWLWTKRRANTLYKGLKQHGMAKIPPKRRKLVLGASGLVILALIGLSVFALKQRSKENTGVLANSDSKPDFNTVLPEGKQENTADDRVAYDPGKKLAGFQDTIRGVTVTVSQQPLPETFKSNPEEEVKKLAEGFGAHVVIHESSPKAYLGTSIKGPQTVIFYKNDVLVFIQSASSIEKEAWAEYITKLY